jgi:hypothetical protein
MNFLPMKTVYRCAKGKSTSLTDLAFQYKRLTLRRDYVQHRFSSTNKTPFTQISVVPFDTVMGHPFVGVKHWNVFEGREPLMARMKETLKQTIFDHWTPGGAHAVLHSSGLDSRCLSWHARMAVRYG